MPAEESPVAVLGSGKRP
uniref:Uncharacterized protein n=1 Tax=Arundo donax TaxID=35708 RepID=A0A0A9AF19_ARUDO